MQPHVRYILEDVGKAGVPVIHFGTGTHALLEAMRDAGGDVIGLDWRTPLDEGWRRVGHDPDAAIQRWVRERPCRMGHLAYSNGAAAAGS